MALQRRAVATNNDGGVASLTAIVNKPAGTLTGDTIFAIVGIADSAGTIAVSAPDGTWTQQVNFNYAATGSQHIDIWTKTAGGSEPSSYSFTIAGTTGGANVAWTTMSAGYFSDAANGSAVVDQKATLGVTEPAGGVAQSASITPSVNNCRLISIFALDDSGLAVPSWAASAPAGLSQLATASETVTNFGTALEEHDQTTATAESHTVTQSGGDTSRGPATAILSIKEVIAASIAAFLVYGHTGLDRIANIEAWLSANVAGWLAADKRGLNRLSNIEDFLTSNSVNSVTFLPYGKTGTDRLWNIESYLLSATSSNG